MTETEFITAADAVLSRVAGALAAAGDGVACDVAGDLLTMRFADGGKCTLIRQVPVQQIWLSDGVVATYFDWLQGEWIDPRGRGSLASVLQAVLSRRLGRPVRIDLAAP